MYFVEGTYLLSKCSVYWIKINILERLGMLEYPSLLYCSRYWYSSMTILPCHTHNKSWENRSTDINWALLIAKMLCMSDNHHYKLQNIFINGLEK